jgi:ferric-dicitrate binding protein FerR (iron transport regulator)
MSVAFPTPDSALVARFKTGDESALTSLYRQQYDALLQSSAAALGADLGHFRGRVAHQAMLDAWNDRARFENAGALTSFLEEAVKQEADIQRRKHASLNHRHSGATPHVTVPGVDDAVSKLQAALHETVNHDAALAEARAAKKTHAKEHVERVGTTRKWYIPVLGTIAAVAIIVFAQRWMDRAGADAAVDRALKSDKVQTLSSNKGQRGSLTLRDGTKAAMGSETRLRIPEEFAGAQRTLLLEGAATFTVTPSTDPKAVAFGVRAGDYTVTATGTQFTVRAYENEAGISVLVSDGTVSVKNRATGLITPLKAGEASHFTATGKVSELDGLARDVAFAFTRDSIVFEKAPLKDVVPELVRWFGINAALADPALGDRPVSMRVALASSGDATKALTESANVAIQFGKDDRIEFVDAPPAPEKATKPAAKKK